MADIPARDLRNDVSAVLRRVEQGERLRVTVSGRPVAEIGPAAQLAEIDEVGSIFERAGRWRADAGLTKELAGLSPDTTDDLPLR